MYKLRLFIVPIALAALVGLLPSPKIEAANIGLIGLANTDWPILGGNNQRNKISPSTDPNPKTVSIVGKIDQSKRFIPGRSFIDPTISPVMDKDALYLVFGRTEIQPISGLRPQALAVFNRHTGKLLWDYSDSAETAPLGSYLTSPTLASDGSVYIGSGLGPTSLTKLSKEGQVVFATRCAHPDFFGDQIPRYSSINIDNFGNLIYRGSERPFTYYCDPVTGKMTSFIGGSTPTGSNAEGYTALDSKSNLFTELRIDVSGVIQNAVAAFTHDKFESNNARIWANAAIRPSFGSSFRPILSADESVLFNSDSTQFFTATRTSDGKVLWQSTRTQTGQPEVGVGSKGVVYFSTHAGGDFIEARDQQSGIIKWRFHTEDENVEVGNILVDKTETLYFYDYVDNSGSLRVPLSKVVSLSEDGHKKWSYDVTVTTGGGRYLIMSDDGTLYFEGDDEFYGMKPWTIDLTKVEKKIVGANTKLTFTAKSTMLKNDPNSTNDNLVQATLDNGQIIPFRYSQQDGDKSLWTAELLVPTSTSQNLKLVGSVEAAAFKMTTTNATHFATLPQDFNNSGVNSKFDFGSVDAIAGNAVKGVSDTKVNFFTRIGQSIWDFLGHSIGNGLNWLTE
jgi:outer membrane protein assembly factor BamB